MQSRCCGTISKGSHPARHGGDHARALRQADGLSYALDRGVQVGLRHGGDVGNGAEDVVGQGVHGHRRHLGLKARDFEAWPETKARANEKDRPPSGSGP